MGWIILEALVALLLGVGIVWWTMSPARKREREEEQRYLDSIARDEKRDGSGSC